MLQLFERGALGRVVEELGRPGAARQWAPSCSTAEFEDARTPGGELVNLVPDLKSDRCRVAFMSSHGERVVRKAQIERVPAIANPHVKARELLRQSRMEP